MLLVRKLRLHIGPILLAIALTVVAAAWQGYASWQNQRSVSGSSVPGLVIGSFAAAIILFELLLWPRKALRRIRLFKTKTWMAYHIWLGLACGPLAFIHAGYRFGGSFTTVLMCLLFFVLASGVYGWILQIVIPRWMLDHLPQETVASQIEDVSVLNALEARQMLTVSLGPKPDETGKLESLDAIADSMRGTSLIRDEERNVQAIVVGARQRRLPPRRAAENAIQGIASEEERLEIWKGYASVIEPFLLHGSKRMGQLATPQRAKDWFQLLRQSSSTVCEPLIDRLESWVSQRQQFEMQRRAQAWLHGWIGFHAGASILLGILLIAHIITAIQYW